MSTGRPFVGHLGNGLSRQTSMTEGSRKFDLRNCGDICRQCTPAGSNAPLGLQNVNKRSRKFPDYTVTCVQYKPVWMRSPKCQPIPILNPPDESMSRD